MTGMQTLEQRRARHAWEAVQEAKANKKAQAYKRNTKQLPIRIMTAGLGHALAFVNAKDGSDVGCDVARWVLKRLKSEAGHGVDPAKSLMEQITREDADWLRQATREALACLEWLSRFAEAEIEDKATEDRDNSRNDDG